MPVTFYESLIKSEQKIDDVHACIKSSNEKHFINRLTIENIYCNSFSSGLSIRTVFKGPMKYEFENKNRVLCPGNILAFNKNQEFCSYNYKPCETELFSIFFNEAFVKQFYAEAYSGLEKTLDEFETPSVIDVSFNNNLLLINGSLFNKVIALKNYLSAHAFDQNIIDEELFLIFENIFYTHKTDLKNKYNNLLPAKPSTKTEVLKRVCVARDYIESNFTQSISLNSISKNALLSGNHLLRNFKSVFKITPAQYIIRKRLELAKTLLACTSLSVANIVVATGFENASSFGRLFKKNFQLPPEQWRFKYCERC